MVRFRRVVWIVSLLLLVLLGAAGSANAESNFDTYFLPDEFAIDRTPVSCGVAIFVLDKKLPVAGINKGDGHIVLNPDILASMPTVMKLYVASHECAYSIIGRKDEAAAICWAVKNGRDQGWFPPEGFALLTRLLRQPLEPGWPPRLTVKQIQAMRKCYAK